jgi:HAE1 family hydrophobic/amphiphilic exporter-1
MLKRIISRPIGACFIALSMALLGIMALHQLPVALLPPVELPVITVRCDKAGASAIELEDQLLRPLEQALSTVPSLTSMEGLANAGAVEVRLSIRADADLEAITNRLRERLSGIPLPVGTDPPRVLRFDPSTEPLMRLILEPVAGGPNATTLAAIARDEFTPQVEGLSEVASVRLRGGRETEVRVIPDPSRLIAAGLSGPALEAAVRGAVSSRSVGTVLDQEGFRQVRLRGSTIRPDDLPRILVAPGVTLKDVASVEQVLAEPEELAVALQPSKAPPGPGPAGRTSEAILVEVLTQADAGLVAASDAVRERIAQLARPTGAGTWNYGGGRLTLLTDRAEAVRNAIGEVKSATIEGAILAWLVILLFLRALKPSLIVFLAIPLSVIGTFLLMSLAGVGLNLMSLGGLALGVGMLVDTAIVVLEAADRVSGDGDHGGPSRAAAIAIGVGEVAGAVVASCLTSVAVFVPLAFLPGVLGRLFYDQAFTVSASHVVSLAVGLGLVPTLLALPALRRRRLPLSWWWPLSDPDAQAARAPVRLLRALAAGLPWLLVCVLRAVAALSAALIGAASLALRLPLRLVSHGSAALLSAVERIYGSVLDALLQRPALGLVGFALALLLGLAFIPRLPVRVMPPSLSTRFTLAVELPRGRSVDQTARWAADFLALLRSSRHDLDAVALAGEDERYAPSLTRRQAYELELVITIQERARDPDAERSFLTGLEHLALTQGAVAASAAVPPLINLGLGTGDALAVAVRGPDAETLRHLALDFAARLRVAGCRGVLTSATASADEVLVVPDDGKLLEAGLTLDQVQAAIAAAADIHEITGFIPRFSDKQLSTKTLPIRLRGPLREAAPDALENLNLGSAAKPIPLSRVATITRSPGDGLIVRHNGSRVATLTAASLPGGMGARGIIDELLRISPLPAGYDLVGGSLESTTDSSLGAMAGMLALSVFLVLVVMAVQFESLGQPLLVMLAVPMAAAGAFPALWLFGHGLDVMSGIGLVVLVGVAVSNAIVLVSTVNLRREQGLPVRAAISRAGRERLRPILMTTATSVLGLLPLAVGWSIHYDWPPTISVGEAVELRAPLAIAVMGGLCSSTVLVLLSLPSVLLLVARTPAQPRAADAPHASAGQDRDPAAALVGPPAGEPDPAPAQHAQHAPGG